MKNLRSLIAETCLSPCCRLGRGRFWEKLLFGSRTAELQHIVHSLESAGAFFDRSCDPNHNVELIEIQTRSASRKAISRTRVPVLAMKAGDPELWKKHAAKKQF